MKKSLCALLILAALALCAGAAAETGVFFNGDTNIRSGPGLDFTTIGSVGAGSTLPWTGGTSVDNRGVTWYCVLFGDVEGWVSSRYSMLSDGEGSATFGSGGADYSGYSSESYDASASATTVMGASGDSNIRSGPGLDYPVLGTLPEGGTAVFLGGISYDSRGVAWYQISWDGGSAWVSSRFTQLY